ncbi:MAG: amino acid ABC transporter substrate-binding protein [candidate division NC10 bacterium]|nr:amino acid ABC transporter substrate-binding protein [candidate division NC10 bacterium]
MSASSEVVAGVSLSLSGRFRLQGQAALNGIRLWVDQTSPFLPLRLIVLDDESRSEQAREHVLRLVTRDRVDLLLGPYSSVLTMAVAPLAEGHGKILWNHGGASDAIYEQGWRHLVSLPSPASDYLRALPILVRQTDPEIGRIGILHAKAGSFAAHVARGATEGAKAAGFGHIQVNPFDSPIADPGALLREAFVGEPELLIGVGSFQDDVAILRQRGGMSSVKALCVVAAGLGVMHREVGALAEGVIAPSQWEPGVKYHNIVGPDLAWFLSEYRARFQHHPDYPAVQAFAAGVVFMECFRVAGSLEDERLLAAARAIDLTTLFGRFRLDPTTGRQVGHQPLLIQWQDGRKRVIWPEESAQATLRYPLS